MWQRAVLLAFVLVAGCSSEAAFRYPGDADAGADPDVTPAIDSGDGRDGPLTVTAALVVNTCASVSVGAGTDVTLGDALAPVAGTRLLVFQVADEFAVLGESAAITAPGAAGRFELARVASAAGDALTLEAALAFDYLSNGAGLSAQVCTVPELTDLTVQAGGEIRAPPWDGRRGGVAAVLASGTVVVDGAVLADAAGFRGGGVSLPGDATVVTSLSTAGEDGGGKGEGLDLRGWLRFGRGMIATAGGGGNSSRAGGGGGGGGGAGGSGGRDTTSAADTQGGGGAALDVAAAARLSFGGAGGGGHQVQAGGLRGGEGGAGGGVVLVIADSLSGSGTFAARGAAGADGGFVVADGADGAGGGGAGGTILLRTGASSTFAGSVLVPGANGGDVRSAAGGVLAGPGGGGGGGRVGLSNVTVGGAVDVAPGNPGTNLDLGNDPNGATGGAAGTVEDE